jgi:glycosyltransferase involved in cell wall biosynthesis
VTTTDPIPIFVEVTNTLATGHTTGIQRLTREILARLPRPGDGGPIAVTPIVWESTHLKYRALTDDESGRLAITPAPTAARRARLAGVPAPLARVVRGTARRARALTPRRRPSADVAHLIVDPLPEGSVWLDLEAAWHGPVPRTELLPRLWAFGVPSAVMVPDVMPLMWPEWFEDRMARRYRHYLDAHLNRSDLVLCISRCTEDDVLRVGKELAPNRELHTLVAPMGADHRRPTGAAALPGELVGRRFLLYVATVEPRKNHALLLSVLDRLEHTHPDVALVFVGKAGWKVDAIERRIDHHHRRGDALHWYRSLDDATLDSLYHHAFLSVVPSFYEGFGIPVVESLEHGVPVVSSSGGALPETGGSFAEYAAPDDLESWVTAISRHLDFPEWHGAARGKLAGYRPPSWDECARVVVEGLSNTFRPD